MRVLYVYRNPDLGFSIGRVFQPIETEIGKYVEAEAFYLPVANYSLKGLFKNVWALHKFLKRNSYDIIHITGSEHYLIPFLIGHKVVVTVHDLAFVYRHKKKWSYFLKYLLFVKTLKFASVTTFISKKTEAETLAAVKLDRYKTIYNPVDNKFKYQSKTFNKDCPRILHIGTRPQKNLGRTIEALAGIPCLLRIIGNVTSLEKQRMEELGIKYSIGENLSDEDIIEEYNKCDIVNFPSTYEGYGLPIVEGQTTGRAVLTSGIQPMYDISGGAAILVAPASVESIRRGLLAIINNDSFRESIINRGKHNVERFRLDKIAKEYLTLYEELLNKTKKGNCLESFKKYVVSVVYKCVTYISNKTRHDYINIKYLKTYKCSSKDLKYISSSNNITIFNDGKKKLFFKECKKHIEFGVYIRQVIADYFKYIYTSGDIEIVESIIYEDIKRTRNKKLLSCVDKYCYSHYSCTSSYTGWDTKVIGLPTLFEKYNSGESIEIMRFMAIFFPKFLKYIRNEVSNYNMNKYLAKGELQTFRCSHSVATKKLADLLGLSNLVPRTEYVRLIIDGNEERIGMIVEESPGVCPLILAEDEKEKISPEFQRQLLNLHIFDTICFQRDHKQENYFVSRNEQGYISGLSAFDNDSPQTFFPFPTLNFQTSMRCSSIVNSKNEYNRPYIDKELADAIMRLDSYEIKELLYSDLSSLQIYVLCIRIKKMQKVIKMLDGKKKISNSEWTQKTIEEELSGKYGNTYLKHYMEADENALVAQIMNNLKNI